MDNSITQLLAQIDAEYQSARRAIRDFSQGSSQHQFITQKMENMRVLQEMIADSLGDEMEAAKLVCDRLDQIGDVNDGI